MINIWVQILLIHNAFLIKLTLVKKSFSPQIFPFHIALMHYIILEAMLVLSDHYPF